MSHAEWVAHCKRMLDSFITQASETDPEDMIMFIEFGVSFEEPELTEHIKRYADACKRARPDISEDIDKLLLTIVSD